MAKEKLILITNPGSASRKYALYRGKNFLCSLHYEFERGKVICTLKRADDTKEKITTELSDLSRTVSHLKKVLDEKGFISDDVKLDAILARVVATGDYFTSDHIVDEECLRQLEIAKRRTPLHVPVVANEIEKFVRIFEGTPVLTISDSAFHNDRPKVAKYYAIDMDLADKHEIKKYGAHGLSVGSIVEYMKSVDILPEKMIVCHIGSGSSVTAVFQGKSYDTTMGYTPLEGVMM